MSLGGRIDGTTNVDLIGGRDDFHRHAGYTLYADPGVIGQRIVVKGKEVPADGTRLLTKTFTIKHPRLWQPGHPELYPMAVSVE